MGLFKKLLKTALEDTPIASMISDDDDEKKLSRQTVDDDEISEADFNEDFDENDYDIDELEEESDEDLQELGEEVDRLIEENDGEIDGDDLEVLHDKAQACGLSVEEFDQMLENRLEELREAIEAGYHPRDVYRTRSVWRRCPNCGWLNSADSTYCEWCGYQLRHRTASFVLGSLIAMGAAGGDPKKLHKKHIKKTVTKANKGKKAAKKTEKSGGIKKKSALNSTTSKKAPEKKSLFGSKNTENKSEKKSLFGGKTPDKSSEKKSLFGSSKNTHTEVKAKSSSLGGSKKSSSKSSMKLGGIGKKRR